MVGGSVGGPREHLRREIRLRLTPQELMARLHAEYPGTPYRPSTDGVWVDAIPRNPKGSRSKSPLRTSADRTAEPLDAHRSACGFDEPEAVIEGQVPPLTKAQEVTVAPLNSFSCATVFGRGGTCPSPLLRIDVDADRDVLQCAVGGAALDHVPDRGDRRGP